MNNKILNLSMLFSLASLLLVSATTGESGTGRISGKLIIEGSDTIKPAGEVYFYNSETGPPPSPDKYWRVPDIIVNIKEDAGFSLELTEGEYYMEVIIRTSGSDIGPPMEGDYYFLSSDKEGRPKAHLVESGKSVDLGVISSAVLYQPEAVEGKITGIKGTVIDANGKPAEGIVVFANEGDNVKFGFVSDTTGVDGKYLLRVHQGGEYRIIIMDIRGDRPPIHAISIKGYDSDIVPMITDEIIRGVDLELVYTGTSGKR